MPSPFPGMDPYIESSALWPAFHNDLASAMRTFLNQHIQPRYFARLTPYVTYADGHFLEMDLLYYQPPPPPLTPEEGAWLARLLDTTTPP